MTTAIRHPGVLIAVLAVLATALTACGSGPTQINSAVIIGDRVVSVDEVQRRLDTALDTEPAAKDLARNRKLDLVSRGIVNQLVRHELIAEAAEREGLTVSERDLAELTASTAPPEDPVLKAVTAGFDGREIARDRLLLQALGRKYLERLQVRMEAATVASEGDSRQAATDLARKVAAQPDRMAQLIEEPSTAQVRPAPVDALSPVSTYGFFAQQQVQLAPVFSVQPNTVVAFQFIAGEQSGANAWLVALIKERNTNATLSEQERSIVSQVPPEWNQAIGTQLISPLAGELGVRISPRYGVWDELAVGVAPNESEKVGLVLPAAMPKP
ncbi:MAG TPA: SurA N-terminal domain-containing protein [Actinophytocola sp.]|uniref:SurA N-terminal domain-containing protein n=1 Tax=Actinophytocola sp. TaxID=1872138 RepID=UPI002DDD0A4D|nr:SurA N-terminal domain-containing protein [Actinophytocola sp.]HEV2782756.1 SurA N-terminal domain-containing protein [Actinophytocola sp.]